MDRPGKGLSAPGDGRPVVEVRDPELEGAVETLLASETAGDPMGLHPKARHRSLRALSTKLTAAGHTTSRTNRKLVSNVIALSHSSAEGDYVVSTAVLSLVRLISCRRKPSIDAPYELYSSDSGMGRVTRNASTRSVRLSGLA